jgi:hypothetical protein
MPQQKWSSRLLALGWLTGEHLTKAKHQREKGDQS